MLGANCFPGSVSPLVQIIIRALEHNPLVDNKAANQLQLVPSKSLFRFGDRWQLTGRGDNRKLGRMTTCILLYSGTMDRVQN